MLNNKLQQQGEIFMNKVTLEMVLNKVIKEEPEKSRIKIIAQNGILDKLDSANRETIKAGEPTPTLVFGLLTSTMMALLISSHRDGNEEMFGDDFISTFMSDFVELHEKITKVCVNFAIEGILEQANEVPQSMKDANDIIERIKSNIN